MKKKVEIKSLEKIYSNGDGVKDINLTIYENEILTLLGPSGCGKTTILRALGGFESISSGEIFINDVDVTNIIPEKRPTAMVFQSYNLWPHMTVFENLSFGLKIRKKSKSMIQTEIADMLALIKMPDMGGKYPRQLSGGQQQRIAIARALLLQPEVLLLDEPFSALDAKIRMQMREELKKIQKALGITVVFVTHDQEEAMSLSDRIVVMDKGKIAQIGSPTEIYEQPSSQYIASFIGEMNFIKNFTETIAIRPEDIKLIFDEDVKTEYQGVVQNVMLLGHYAAVILTTELGEIKVFVPRIDSEQITIGHSVNFAFEQYHTFKTEVMNN